VKLPLVAIVGRPNVGKSSLLNAFAGERVSIVEETPGVTRDRVSTIIVHEDVTMEIVDTGGLGIVDRDDLEEHVERQIDYAVRDANAILFVTDVRDGLTPLDIEVAAHLRQRSQEIPVFLVVNKVDTEHLEAGLTDFHRLAMGEPRPVSAQESSGTQGLLDRVAEKLWPTGEVDVSPVMKLAVVGRRNVGKSTFVNSMTHEERVIVSEIPGTTRDAVDVQFEKDGRRFTIIDTAGIQRKSRLKDSVALYSQQRTQTAIRRADVVLFLLDASKPITRGDKWLGNFISTVGRVCIIVANKWDLAHEHMATGEYAEYLEKIMPGLRHAPVAVTTALNGRNLQATVDLAQQLYKVASKRVSTGELNRVLRAIEAHNPPRARAKKPRIYYATQVAAPPPTFVLFVNDPGLFSESYRRYVENAFREALEFEELPIKLFWRARDRSPSKRQR
jgi:GTP-binding protein